MFCIFSIGLFSKTIRQSFEEGFQWTHFQNIQIVSLCLMFKTFAYMHIYMQLIMVVLVGANSEFLSINPNSSLCFHPTLTVSSNAVVNSTVGRIKGDNLSPPGHHKWLGTAPHLD